MALLVSDAKSSFERLKKDISDVSNTTFIEWCKFAQQQAYRFLIGVDPGRFVLTNTYSSVTSGSQSLPASFKSIQPAGTGIYEVGDDGNPTETRLVRTGYGSQSKGYYIEAGNVVFTGVEDAETFIMRYIPKLTAVDELTDYFTIDTTSGGVEVIEEEYLRFLRDDLDTLYSQWDEVPGEESLADFRFVRLLAELAKDYKREPDVYSIPRSSRAF